MFLWQLMERVSLYGLRIKLLWNNKKVEKKDKIKYGADEQQYLIYFEPEGESKDCLL